ncbi:MAG TPA: type II toxin-antitoxin system Phd/YefM family antitoxin [Kineosporiaceae bacterium]
MTTETEPPASPELPTVYRRAVARWGEPLGIEDARQRWADLVTAAEAGTITLIRRGDRDDWVALVPIQDLTEPVDQLPVWSLRDARPKLGHLVVAATGQWQTSSPPTPQVLTRRGRPVAALVAAMHLARQVDLGERLAADAVLMDGATITLTYHPDQPGSINEDDDVVNEPEPGGFMALATDDAGNNIGVGYGATAVEALLGLYQPRQHGDLPAELYDAEPPF